jgi:hypothetical protein
MNVAGLRIERYIEPHPPPVSFCEVTSRGIEMQAPKPGVVHVPLDRPQQIGSKGTRLATAPSALNRAGNGQMANAVRENSRVPQHNCIQTDPTKFHTSSIYSESTLNENPPTKAWAMRLKFSASCREPIPEPEQCLARSIMALCDNCWRIRAVNQNAR